MDGILLVDKPKGWTSNDICQFVKRRFRFNKVGHGGSLDPFATGLMILYLNRATRLSSQGLNDEKEYEGILELGIQTSTGDPEGDITIRADIPEILDEGKISEVFDELIGPGLQMPPMHSAVKRNGVPLYRLARKGIEVERKERPIEIFELRLLSWQRPYLKFYARVSKGTYLRVLAADIGKKLDTVASLKELRRTASGEHHIQNSICVDKIKKMNSQNDLSSFLSLVSSALLI